MNINWDLWLSILVLVIAVYLLMKYPGTNTWDDRKDYD